MALTVGELVGYIDLDDRGFGAAIDSAGRDLTQLSSKTSQTTSTIESAVSQAFARVAQAIGDGMDPNEALADMQRLVDGVDQALSGVDDNARADGQRAGDQLVDGIKSGLSGADQVARQAGDRAGSALGEGTESSGRSRMGGAAAGLIGVLKAAPWLAAGAAIGAAVTAGFTQAMDAQEAKQKLFAQVGAFGPEAKKLGSVAGKVYAQGYGESMGDVTDAVRLVVQNLDGVRDASEDSLGALSKSAMDAATIMDEDVGRVTAAVSQMLRNDLAPNAQAAFDILIKGAQNGANKSEDLLDTFNEYSTQFRDLGLNAQDALGLMSQGLKAGARDADTVADALKEFAIRAKDGSDTSADAFAAIGLNSDKMFKLFAKGGEPAKQALGDVLDRIRAIKDPVEKDAVAVGLFGTKAEDLQDALLALDPSTAATSLGTLTGAAKTAGDTLHDTAATKIEAFKRGMQTGIVDFIGNSVLPKLEELGPALSMSGLGTALEGSKEAVVGFFDGVTEKISTWAADNGEHLGALKTAFDENFGSIKTLVTEVLDGIKIFWDEWGDEILSIVTIALNAVMSFIGGAIELISGIFKTAKGVLTGNWTGVWDGLKSITEGGTRGIRSLADSGMRLLGEAMGFNWDQIKATATRKLDELVKSVGRLPADLKAWAVDAGTWLLQAGRDMINGMINGVKEKAADLVNAARGVVSGAVQAAKNLLNIKSPSKVFATIGSLTMAGFIQGLTSRTSAVMSAVKGAIGPAVAWAQNASSGSGFDGRKSASVTGEPASGGSGWRDYGGAAGSGGTGSWGTVVQVDMSGATIREEADVHKIGANIGFQFRARGAV